MLKYLAFLNITVCITAFLATSKIASAQISEFSITTSDGAANDEFGYSVSISGDYAVVGAIRDDDAGSISGSAYIYFRDGGSWTQQAKLTASVSNRPPNFLYFISSILTDNEDDKTQQAKQCGT